MDSQPSSVPGRAPSTATPSTATPWRGALPSVGEMFGPYRIVERIGDGGMGVVLRARELVLDRDVALKLIQPELLACEGVQISFLEEARAMAAISHPNVVQIYALGREEGVPYFAMELFEGGSLQQRLGMQRPMRLQAALRILRGVAEGLTAIHRRGRVHGDVKPSNVLFTADDERVAITDMGLSYVLGSGSEAALRGTPAYMAPERATGDLPPPALQPRQDVYSLGVMAFELLTGRLPFVSQRADVLLDLHAGSDPPRPSVIGEGLDERFDRPVLRALEKRPADRTATAIELVEQLEAAARAPRVAEDLRILVVDDDDDWRELILRGLRRRFPQASIQGAPDGRAGLEQAMLHPPDVALVDLSMPGLDGLEVTRALRELAPPERLAIVVLSGEGGARDWQILRELGADRFFVKPVDFDELCETLSRLVQRAA